MNKLRLWVTGLKSKISFVIVDKFMVRFKPRLYIDIYIYISFIYQNLFHHEVVESASIVAQKANKKMPGLVTVGSAVAL